MLALSSSVVDAVSQPMLPLLGDLSRFMVIGLIAINLHFTFALLCLSIGRSLDWNVLLILSVAGVLKLNTKIFQ